MAKDKCCELMEKEEWEGKTVTWKDKVFVKKKYSAFFYMPLGLDGLLKDLMKELDQKNLMPGTHPYMLWRNEGMFGGEILIPIKKKDPEYDTVTLSGKYYTKFYEGKGYSEAGKWHKDFKESTKGKIVQETMAEYALCPGCMKKFGKMQAVLYGKVN